MKELDKRQRDFCRYKAEGLSNEAAALKAGYSKSFAHDRSHELSDNPRISELIKEYSKKAAEIIEEKFSYTIADSFKELELVKNLALTPDGENGRINAQAALKAIELKGKLMGLYIDRNMNHNTDEKEKGFAEWLEGLK